MGEDLSYIVETGGFLRWVGFGMDALDLYTLR